MKVIVQSIVRGGGIIDEEHVLLFNEINEDYMKRR